MPKANLLRAFKLKRLQKFKKTPLRVEALAKIREAHATADLYKSMAIKWAKKAGIGDYTGASKELALASQREAELAQARAKEKQRELKAKRS